jgi:hypothetical protein
MGRWQGALDGEALGAARRAQLLANHAAFGRHERRNFKRPHAAVLATADDPPGDQRDDFSRAACPRARRSAAAAGAWLAVRRARLACGSFSAAAIASEYGDEACEVLRTETDAFDAPAAARAPAPSAPAWTRPQFTISLVGRSENLLFCDAPGASEAVHWFSPCAAAAPGHPESSRFLRAGDELTPVGAYAVHERAGAVRVASARAGAADCGPAGPLPSGGLVYVAHPTVLEGGCALFSPASVRRVGVYCRKRDGRTWTPELLRRVLALLSPGGVIHTNCVSTRFLTDL